MNDPMYEWRDVSAELVTAAVSAWLERFRDQRFSLADAVSFEVMSRDGLEQAFAFDRGFRTAGFEMLAVGSPGRCRFTCAQFGPAPNTTRRARLA